MADVEPEAAEAADRHHSNHHRLQQQQLQEQQYHSLRRQHQQHNSNGDDTVGEDGNCNDACRRHSVVIATDVTVNHRRRSPSRCCVNTTLQIALSTPGLVVLVVAYSLMGALIFPVLEAPAEPLLSPAVVLNSREECLKELWTITGE